MQYPIEDLEEKIGYFFSDRHLLIRSLTHRSWLSEQGVPMPEDGDNEQLEFLGDAVLGFVVSEELVRRYPEQREGSLSQLKAHLVSSSHLHQCALALGLGDHLQLGRGEDRNGGRERRRVLANALEAMIAALHLDGGINVARNFINRVILPTLDKSEEFEAIGLLNHKSLLQERAQAMGLPAPRYSTVRTSGPEHAKLFTVEVRVNQDLTDRATASSKKAASQLAAGQLFEKLVSGNWISGEVADAEDGAGREAYDEAP